MPTFRYAKLVRDNIPGFHIESGHTFTGRKLKGKELVNALVAKLHEETDEVDGALSHDELVEELADIQQIIDDLCTVSGISKKDMTAVMTKKAARKGGFLQGEYIETVTMPTDDEWVAYCRNAPDKYPEVKVSE
ncbi:MAG TPA: nucleoside triphosphate pyrophosphohydrolase [Candidatus Saccharibacteria bacterium]|nr:nucleoside triphosphate pyrophosphohydrolase [Candidatus Saccharibacteria bacterium]